MKRLWAKLKGRPRILHAVWCLLVALLLPLLLGGGIGLIFGNFWSWAEFFFLAFCAPMAVVAALLLFSGLDEDWAYGIGCGLYYGTVFGAWLFRRMGEYETAFAVSALICYIAYSKNHRKE